MPSRKEFVANELNTEETAKAIGADALFYQDLEDLVEAVNEGNPEIKNFCMACFDGNYPTSDVTEEVLRAAEASRVQVDPVENQIPML